MFALLSSTTGVAWILPCLSYAVHSLHSCQRLPWLLHRWYQLPTLVTGSVLWRQCVVDLGALAHRHWRSCCCFSFCAHLEFVLWPCQESHFQTWQNFNMAFNYSSALCAAGYDGVPCSTCTLGYYRLESNCLKCPRAAYAIIIGIALAGRASTWLWGFVAAGGSCVSACVPCTSAVACTILAYYANKKRINFSAMSIAIDFLQVISIFTSFKFAWYANRSLMFPCR